MTAHRTESESKKQRCLCLDLRNAGVPSRVQKYLLAFVGRETAELCLFDAVAKLWWTSSGEISLAREWQSHPHL